MLAACKALCFARELDFDQVICERDSEIIIKVIKRGGLSSSSFGHIINYMRMSKGVKWVGWRWT